MRDQGFGGTGGGSLLLPDEALQVVEESTCSVMIDDLTTYSLHIRLSFNEHSSFFFFLKEEFSL